MKTILLELAANLWKFASWISDDTKRIKVTAGAIGVLIVGMFLLTAYTNPAGALALLRFVFIVTIFSAVATILVLWFRKVRMR